MKKYIAALIAAVFLSSLPCVTTLTDGSWHDPNVWQGGIVPSASDNVIITRLITITGNAECHDLTMQGADSMVRNNYQTNSTLTVYGNIMSTGWIASHAIYSNHLTVNLYGDLESYYNFTPGTLNMLGTGNRHWTLDDAYSLAPYLGINIAASIDTVFTGSNVNLSTSNTSYNTLIQGVDAPFVIALGGTGDRVAYNLAISNCTVQNGVILGSGTNSLTWTNTRNGYMRNLTLKDLNLMSGSSVLMLEGVLLNNIISSATIYNYSSNNQSLTLEGSFVNNGDIRSNPSSNKSLYAGVLTNSGSIRNHPSGYTLQTHILGDTVNSGTISCYMLYFDATLSHLANPGTISSPYLYITAVSAEWVLQNSMAFTNTVINFTGGSTGMLRLNAGRTAVTLTMNNGNLRNANLLGGPGARLDGSGTFVLTNSTADEIIVGGLVQIENVSIAHLINQGTIRNNSSYNQTLSISQRLDNYGIITNHTSYQLFLNLYGDCYDFGWISNYQTSFLANGDQILYQDAAADTLRCPYLYKSSSTGNLVLASDLRTRNTTINLGGHNLQMYRGRSSYGLYMYGGSLSSAYLDTSGYAVVWMAANAYLNAINGNNVVFTGSCYLLGTCQYNNVVNNGTLRNYPSTWGYLHIPGDFTNNGYVYDATSYNLTLYLGGDFVNYGTTNCYAIYINGTSDQQVLRGGVLTTAQFYLVSNIGSSLWYLNAAPTGYNGSSINIPISASSVLGQWQPYNQGTLTWGRMISIMIPEAPGAPPNLVISCMEGIMTLQWGQVLNAASYRVYESNLPDGSYSLFRDNVMDDNPDDGLVSISFPENTTGRFYKVSSRN